MDEMIWKTDSLFGCLALSVLFLFPLRFLLSLSLSLSVAGGQAGAGHLPVGHLHGARRTEAKENRNLSHRHQAVTDKGATQRLPIMYKSAIKRVLAAASFT